MFTYIIYIICIAIALFAVIPVTVLFLLGIYSAPYCYWVGMQHCRGRYKELGNDGIRRNAYNATILYKSWLFHKAPVFR